MLCTYLHVCVYTYHSQEYCASVQASENISFYLAVEFFKVSHCDTPKIESHQRPSSKKSALANQANTDTEPMEIGRGNDQESTIKQPRKSKIMKNFISQDLSSNASLNQSQIELVLDASNIFERYLEDGAEHWVCIETKHVDDIREKLVSKYDVDTTVFDKAQSQIYTSMQSVS